ncbi:putative U3 small nucleolar RNA-associated protein 21 like protein [Blattamonas nauphoetae]|uniref:U3 small nucleolar RNA-associated protein 21 like protein n=1 Tax=Blattamonas nauphoetae TaxID=2049346 RepID=A0ABQ9YLK3_9EUKA|nr:putative U3 small nucleolar RNA-associated protein 21 like protein [Blattamonas nauphoetae]
MSEMIIVLTAAPALDILAAGFLDGRILLINAKRDTIVLRFRQESPVSGLSFRTDGIDILVSASTDGLLHVWDLDKKILACAPYRAHNGSIRTCEYVAGNNLIVTSGEDNSLKVWTLNKLTFQPRLIRQRNGHTFPPTCLSFVNEEGNVSSSLPSNQLLSGAPDRSFRLFHLIRDEQSHEMSQKKALHLKGKKRHEEEMSVGGSNGFGFTQPGSQASKFQQVDSDTLRAVTGMAVATLRDPLFPGIATIHSHDSQPRFWHFHNHSLSSVKPHTSFQTSCRAVAISNTGVISAGGGKGSVAAFSDSEGFVEVISVQSGLRLFRFDTFLPMDKEGILVGGDEARKEELTQSKGFSHIGMFGFRSIVTSLFFDVSMQSLFGVSSEGLVIQWKLDSKQLVSSTSLSAILPHSACVIAGPSSTSVFASQQSLLCTALTTGTILVMDISISSFDTPSTHVVRTLSGHTDLVTAMSFSPDSRTVFSASLDGTIRIWDVPTGKQVDLIKTTETQVENGKVLGCPRTPVIALAVCGDRAGVGVTGLKHKLKKQNATKTEESSLLDVDAEEWMDDQGGIGGVRLATSHAGWRGIQLWRTTLKTSSSDSSGGSEDTHQFDLLYAGTTSVNPLHTPHTLLTLSQLPSYSLNLIRAPLIASRSAAQAKSITTANASSAFQHSDSGVGFFLPTISGLTPQFAPLVKQDDTASRRVNLPIKLRSKFSLLLAGCAHTHHLLCLDSVCCQNACFAPLLHHIHATSPAALHVDIASLSPQPSSVSYASLVELLPRMPAPSSEEEVVDVDDIDNLIMFVKTELSRKEGGHDYDIIQAALNVMLVYHADDLIARIGDETRVGDETTQIILRKISTLNTKRWTGLETLFQTGLSLVSQLMGTSL